MTDFMFQCTDDHILFFKGIVKIDEIEPKILEEFFELTNIEEIRKYFNLTITSGYKRYGCGYDEDGDFRTNFLFDAKKSRGAFMVTELQYEQKQHLWDCQNRIKMQWNRSLQINEKVIDDGKVDGYNSQYECEKFKHKSNFIDHHYCRTCKEYLKATIRK